MCPYTEIRPVTMGEFPQSTETLGKNQKEFFFPSRQRKGCTSILGTYEHFTIFL